MAMVHTCMHSGAQKFLEGRGLAARAEAAGGSFFSAGDIPEAGQLHNLGYILHDWEDASCVNILRAVAARMGDDATVLVVEYVRSLPFCAAVFVLSIEVVTVGTGSSLHKCSVAPRSPFSQVLRLLHEAAVQAGMPR